MLVGLHATGQLSAGQPRLPLPQLEMPLLPGSQCLLAWLVSGLQIIYKAAGFEVLHFGQCSPGDNPDPGSVTQPVPYMGVLVS